MPEFSEVARERFAEIIKPLPDGEMHELRGEAVDPGWHPFAVNLVEMLAIEIVASGTLDGRKFILTFSDPNADTIGDFEVMLVDNRAPGDVEVSRRLSWVSTLVRHRVRMRQRYAPRGHVSRRYVVISRRHEEVARQFFSDEGVIEAVDALQWKRLRQLALCEGTGLELMFPGGNVRFCSRPWLGSRLAHLQRIMDAGCRAVG